MRDHTEIEELFALEALGGLGPEDRARVASLTAEHGADCAECAELRAGFSETAAMLGAALPPTPLSADLEDRTVAAALAAPARAAPALAAPARAAPALAAPVTSAPSAPSRRWRVALVAVAAAVVLVAVGALGGYLAAPRSGFEAFVDQPGVQLIPFEPANGGSGTMTLAVSADGNAGYVIGSGVQAPPAGQVYELWTIAGETPTSIGCLVPTDGVVNQPLTGSFGTADVAAMTVEPSACPAAPSTPPVQVATL